MTASLPGCSSFRWDANTVTHIMGVRAFGTPDPEALARLRAGITIEGIHYGPIEARIDKEQGDNGWLSFAIREGKNREIKRVCEHLGLTVNRLIRTSFGPFQLGDLKPGEVEEVPARVIEDQTGMKIGRGGKDADRRRNARRP